MSGHKIIPSESSPLADMSLLSSDIITSQEKRCVGREDVSLPQEGDKEKEYRMR